jgi:PLD-like domain
MRATQRVYSRRIQFTVDLSAINTMQNRQRKIKRDSLNNITQRYTDASNMQPTDRPQTDNSVSVSAPMKVESIFKNLELKVIEKIEHADAVVGCIAWLTNKEILRALARVKKGVSIIVQKEEFLRPDLDCSPSYVTELHNLYSKLSSVVASPHCQFEKKAEGIGYFSEGQIGLSVRCVGYAKEHGEATLPRMHHKFLVFCKYDEDCEEFWYLKPYAVWTGSFNMTFNGTQSIENAVCIENNEISKSYFDEWYNMLMISEGLNWSASYAAPDIQLNNLSLIS